MTHKEDMTTMYRRHTAERLMIAKGYIAGDSRILTFLAGKWVAMAEDVAQKADDERTMRQYESIREAFVIRLRS